MLVVLARLFGCLIIFAVARAHIARELLSHLKLQDFLLAPLWRLYRASSLQS